MSESNLSRLPDGAILRAVRSGLQVVRRKKHEWVEGLDKLPKEKLITRTSKTWGSKFLAGWSISRIADWTAARIEAAGWTLEIQEPNPLEVQLDTDIGLVEGERVRTIHVRSDGRYVHAYPVKD